MDVKISVVIPTFKRPQLLIKCLTALKDQRFSPIDYEIIVITDGPDPVSKTEVAYFVYQYSLRNVLYKSLEKKAGPAAARNRGAKFARGEMIVFTDDDCIPDKDWLSGYWKAYLDKQLQDAAFSGRTIVPHSGRPTDYEKNIANLETAEFITANCACTRLAFQKLGGFDEQFPIAWREDSELQFKLISAGIPITKVHDAIVLHPVRNAPWGISLKEQQKSKYNALLHKKYPSLYKQKIGTRPLYNYYGIVLLLPLAVLSYCYQKPVITSFTVLLWLLLVFMFILKRLKGTTRKAGHVLEIIATSVLIPFLSVFWTLYGSLRYKKFLL